MIIYEYSIVNAYATGNSRNIADNDPIPMYWTNDPLPTIPSGKWARYNFPGWVITDIPPPVPTPEPTSVNADLQTAPTVI